MAPLERSSLWELRWVRGGALARVYAPSFQSQRLTLPNAPFPVSMMNESQMIIRSSEMILRSCNTKHWRTQLAQLDQLGVINLATRASVECRKYFLKVH